MAVYGIHAMNMKWTAAKFITSPLDGKGKIINYHRFLSEVITDDEL